ncbi:serine O-acetyltransferase [Oricola sp.]|uniref:serine O-acetyltransferase n=1 Tax=Oricola sp. TaxID=1979950 RepID=UPI003BAB9C8E
MVHNRELQSPAQLEAVDPIWHAVRRDAEASIRNDPVLGAFMHSTILNQQSLEDAVIHRISERLDHPDLRSDLIRQSFRQMLQDDPAWGEVVRVDLQAVYDRDPACTRFIEPLLHFKGFHAIQTHRLAHWLLRQGRLDFALYLQSRASVIYQTDINPAARMGRGIFLDHATGLVVGETAAIGDNVSILHSVTLGGTGKEGSDRHPKIADGVLIGAGAKILGNIVVGKCSKVAAGSVVLDEVPPMTTVAGVPARIVGDSGCMEPSRAMDQMLRK